MRSSAPPLFPLLRSKLQGQVLMRVFLGGGEESVTDVASATGADQGNAAREVARLESAGIITSRRVGRTKLIRANIQAPFYRPLFDLITIVLGPATVLAEHLADVDGIVLAEIFGSWAARYHGEPGPSPADIDLLVVGDPDRDDLHDAAQEASHRLHRPVHPVILSEDRWHTSNQGFIRELRARPRVRVIHPGQREEA